MNKKWLPSIIVATLLLTIALCAGCASNTPSSPGVTTTKAPVSSATTTITDGYGRTVVIPANPERIVCSGSGCLRYISYLGAQDKIVGVDSIEKTKQPVEGRAYALANPQFGALPLIGEMRGKDDPEKIIGISPQVILKTSSLTEQPASAILAADVLQNKTGIPVIAMPYGDLATEQGRGQSFDTLRLIGKITGKTARAEELIAYINATMADLKKRTQDIPKVAAQDGICRWGFIQRPAWDYLHRTGLPTFCHGQRKQYCRTERDPACGHLERDDRQRRSGIYFHRSRNTPSH